MAEPPADLTIPEQLLRELQRLRCAVWRGNDREWLHVNRTVFIQALTNIELIAHRLERARADAAGAGRPGGDEMDALAIYQPTSR